MRRALRGFAPFVVVAAEAYLYWRYAALDALFHYWVHFLAGATIGLFLLTLWGLVRRRPPRQAWAAGFLGHLSSATPDVLFLAAGVLHVAWMDVFALHITVHFIPAPLAVLFIVLAVTLGSWAAASLGRRWVAVGGLAVVVVLLAAALALAGEPPATAAGPGPRRCSVPSPAPRQISPVAGLRHRPSRLRLARQTGAGHHTARRIRAVAVSKDGVVDAGQRIWVPVACHHRGDALGTVDAVRCPDNVSHRTTVRTPLAALRTSHC